ncbi:MAG: hypothetical protein OXC31_17045, partial [Spirochaetaceae bacterium]|nr:hypothetical protein [Spirochaetaceae bacterium]
MVEPILTGAVETTCSDEDLAYVRDLGLVAQADGGPPRIAHPIYAEVVARPSAAAAIREAQERLILRRDTHIDDLAHKLREERVRRVV